MTRVGGLLELKTEITSRHLPEREFIPRERCSWKSTEETALRMPAKLGDDPGGAEPHEDFRKLSIGAECTFRRLKTQTHDLPKLTFRLRCYYCPLEATNFYSKCTHL